jgi:hypothetical protein
LFAQKGEIALTLSLLGILVSVIGIGVGLVSVSQVQNRSSSAQTGTFPYRSILEIRDEAGNLIKWESGMRWQNKYATNNNGDIKDANGNARLVWETGEVPASIQNTKAEVIISLPPGYTAFGSFCTSTPITICSNSKVSTDGLTRSNIMIQKDGNVVYGVRVRKGPATPTPSSCQVQSSGCAPRNVQVDDMSEKTVTVTWDYPSDCPAYLRDTDPFWVDVIRGGTQIVCATESKDNEAQCTLGRAAPPGRILDTNAEEYRKRAWDENREYSVNVYLRDVSGACISSPATTRFTYTVEGEPTGAPQPTNPPPSGSGLQCNRGCIYSQSVGGQQKCFRGACPADAPNCKDGIENGNNGCQYAGDACGIPATEVSCTTGEPIGTPPRPTPPPSGLSCSRPCIYSDVGKCWKGRCDANNPNCKDGIANANVGCSFAGTACGVPATEVSCKTGEPILPETTGTIKIDVVIAGEGPKNLNHYFLKLWQDRKELAEVHNNPDKKAYSHTFPNVKTSPIRVEWGDYFIGPSRDGNRYTIRYENCTPDLARIGCEATITSGRTTNVKVFVQYGDAVISPPPPPTTAPPGPSPTPVGSLNVKVNNRIDRLNRVTIKLDPCPANGDCDKVVEFNGQRDVQRSVSFPSVPKNTRLAIYVRNMERQAGLVERIKGLVNAQENGIAKIDRCPGPVEPDGDQDEKCVVANVPAEVELSLHPAGGTPPPPPPPPSPPPPNPNPGGDWYGGCQVFSGDHPCAPENLEKFFVGEPKENMRKLSAICSRESGGRVNAANLSCLNPGGSNDYSIGLFQINTVGTCVTSTGGDPKCVKKADTDSCVAPLYTPEGNIQAAVGKYAGSRDYFGNPFCPWNPRGLRDKCKLAEYDNTYGGCP